MGETWEDIPGYGGNYQASSLGRIKSKDRIVTKRHRSGKMISQKYAERILTPSIDEYGYGRVHIGFGGKKFMASVHRMVLLAFVGQCPDGMEACHNNGNPRDNSSSNLRWDTHKANGEDRKEHGNYASGDAHPMAKISESVAKGIVDGSVSRAESGLSKAQFCRIKRRVSWKDLGGKHAALV